MKLTILGCGSSGGVPLIGCDCDVCALSHPRNRRSRSSLLIESDAGAQLLVDASPDIRTQALSCGLSSIDALVITHAHADHCHGLDDIRAFNYHRGGAIDLYADAPTMEEIQQRFAYVFTEHDHRYGWYKPLLAPHVIEPDGAPVMMAGMEVRCFRQIHGSVDSIGLCIGDVAYSTDVKTLPDAAMEALRGVKLWIVDCLRHEPSPTHAHLELTLSWIAALRPERAILTHMGHEMDYATLSAALPPGVEMAYDGMVLSVP